MFVRSVSGVFKLVVLCTAYTPPRRVAWRHVTWIYVDLLGCVFLPDSFDPMAAHFFESLSNREYLGNMFDLFREYFFLLFPINLTESKFKDDTVTTCKTASPFTLGSAGLVANTYLEAHGSYFSLKFVKVVWFDSISKRHISTNAPINFEGQIFRYSNLLKASFTCGMVGLFQLDWRWEFLLNMNRRY